MPRTWDDPTYSRERDNFDPPLKCTPAEVELLRKDLEEAAASGAMHVSMEHGNTRIRAKVEQGLAKVSAMMAQTDELFNLYASQQFQYRKYIDEARRWSSACAARG